MINSNQIQIKSRAASEFKSYSRRRLWHAAVKSKEQARVSSGRLFHARATGTEKAHCMAPYVEIILHRGRFWAKSATSGSVRCCCFRSCWTVLSHVMRGRPNCLLQSARGEANSILLKSALSSMRIICPNRVSRRDWIIASSLGCFVSLRTSSFRTNWYHLMPSSIRRPLGECIRLWYRPAVQTIQEYW